MQSDLEHAPVRVPPPLVFLAYLIGAMILNWLFPLPDPWSTMFRLIGGATVLAGLVLGAAAVSRMIRAHTSPDPQRPTTALITDGPYRLTRNPIYLGFLFIYLGFTLFAGTLWGLILSPFLIWTVTGTVIRAEESYLRAKFPTEYEAYRSRARRWV